MPWQVPITVDGLEYPVTFNTENEPTQQDYDEAIQQILQQQQPASEVPVEPTVAPEKELPFFDLSDIGSSLGQAVTSLGRTIPASFGQLYEGTMNPWEKGPESLQRQKEMRDVQREAEQAQAEAEASGDASIIGRSIRSAQPSLGFSLTTLPASLGAGAVTGLGTAYLSGNPIIAQRAGMAAGGAAGGYAAYRMAGSQFLDDARERIDNFFLEKEGRLPNKQEQDEAYQELLPLAQEMGMAEALPEAFGNLALAGAGKYIYRILGGKTGVQQLASGALSKVKGMNALKAVGAGAAGAGTEVGTEAVTDVLQESPYKKLEEGIMQGQPVEAVEIPPFTLERFKQGVERVAEPTLATTAMMGLVGGAGGMAYQGLTRQSFEESEFRDKMTKQAESAEKQLSSPDITPAQRKFLAEKVEESNAALKALDEGRSSDVEKYFNVRFTKAEEPSMPDPDEVAVQLNTDAAKSLEAAGSPESAKAQVGFDATLKGILGPRAETRSGEAPTDFNTRNKDMLPDEDNFGGKFTKPLQIDPTSYRRDGEIETVNYINPETGNVDVFVSAFGNNDFIAYMRQYDENGNPTNTFTSKLERRTEKAGATKKMLQSLQSRLPEGHIYTEDVSVSTDGLRFFLNQLNQGYEPVIENGRPITTSVAISGESIRNDLPIPVDPTGKFENIRITNPKDFVKVKTYLGKMLEGFGVGLNESNVRWENGTAFIDLPVLRKVTPSPTMEQATAPAVEEPTLTPEPELYAPDQVPSEESVYEEPQDRVEGREAEEASLGDSLLRPAEGEVKEEVMPLPEVAADPFAAAPLVDNLPALIAVRDNNATPEQVQSLVDQGLVEQVDGQNIITEAGVAAMPEDQRPKLTPAERAAEVERMGVPVERDATKPEQQNFYEWMNDSRRQVAIRQTPPEVAQPTPSKEVSIITPTIDGPQKVKGKTYLIPNYRGPKLVVRKTKKGGRTIYWAYLENGGMLLDNRYGGQETETESINELLKSAIKRINAWGARTKKTAWEMAHASEIALALNEKKNVLASTVNTYGITLPKGYVKQGDLYVFQPTAAEMPTPDSVAVEPGATRGVQPEPPRGSILEVGKVSPETEISSRENLGPEVAAAEKKQAAADEAAKKRQKKQDESTKNSLNSILDPQKKNAVTGTVTKADVETAREALTNSGEIPNAYLTNVYESLEAFLADKANARLFPSAYARLQTEKNIEGLYENGQTLIFAKQIQVSNLDRNLAKMLGITPEQAAARRVIAHENGHKAISLFTMAEKRELRGYLMRAYSDEQIAKLVETYDEYSDWRTNLESRFEALEELLMRDFEKMEKIPTGGVWDDIVQFLKRVWRRLTGQKGEPTLKNLKDVARLMRNAMKRPAVPLGSFTLKDGGKVKLSAIAPTAGITPEMDAEYLAAVEAGDMEKAQRMVDEAAAKTTASFGYLPDPLLWAETNSAKEIFKMVPKDRLELRGTYRIAMPWDEWVDGVVSMNAVSIKPDGSSIDGVLWRKPDSDSVWFLVDGSQIRQLAYGRATKTFKVAADSTASDALTQMVSGEAVEVGGDMPKIENDLYALEVWVNEGDLERVDYSPKRIKQKPTDPVTRDDNGNVIPPSQRFQPTSPDIRFSRPRFASDTDAATSAGNEAARSTIYSERDMDVREAIRRAYEAMPKDTSVAVPIGELFAKTEELLPDVTQDEFSNVLQDLFEDNGAVLQEGEVVEPLTEQDRRYLALAEDEEANQEELQEMAVKVAKKSGFNVINVGNGITYEAGDEPDSVYGERDNVMSHGGTFGFYFSDNPTVWSDYAKPRRKGEKGRVNRTFLSLKNPFRFSEEFVSYDKLQALLRDGGVALPAEVKSRLDRLVAGGFGDTQPVWKWFHPTHVGAGAIYGESLKKAFTDAGYDGVIHPDSSLIEGGLDTPATSYVVFSPSQIKSADPVTRDDQGRIIPLSRRFDTGADIRGQINVTTPEGRRAGFVVVMPRAAKASRIRVEDAEEAAPTFKSNIDIASKGRVETDEWTGKNIKGVEVPEHNINAPELYMKAAIDLIKNLQGKGYSLIEISESLQDREFEKEIGLKDYDVDVIQKTRKALGFEVQMRMQNARKKTKIEREKLLLDKAIQNLGVYMASSATGEAQVLQEYQFYQNNPRYRFMVLENAAKKDMLKNAGEIVDAATGSADKIVDLVNTENKNATDAAVQQLQEEDVSTAEDDQDAIDLAAGEATLKDPEKSLYEEYKNLLREDGILARLDELDNIKAESKASISAERRNELANLTREERAKLREKNQKRRMEILAKLLGKEEDAKTPEQKKTRQEREKMVETAQKRVEAGKDIDVKGRIESLFPLANTRSEIIDEVGNALLKAAEQRKVKPKQRTAIQDFVSAIKQTLMANIKGDKLNADQPSLGMLLAKTFAQQGSEAKAFAESWANGRKKVREMLIEMGIEQENLNAELDAIMPPTPTLAYAPAAARRAVSNAMREIGLMRSDLLNDPVGSKKAIMDKFDEAAKDANLTEEGWDQKGRDLAEKAVDESIVEAKIAQERAKKVAKILSEQADKPVSLEEFGVKLAEFRFKKDKIVELFNRAKKLAEKKVQMANDQAIRVLFAAENKLAQSAFFNDAEKPDTIVKAFREQVEEPMDRDAFKKRMEKMLVTPEMADRLFDKAARERDNARWKKAQDFLEGPKARQNLLREMNKARPAGKTPLEQSIPWKTILSQNPETFEQYRQRIFDAISSIEDLQGITEEQKERLAELYAEALQEKRDTILDSLIRKAVQEKRRENLLGEQAEKAIIESTNKIIDLVNLGGFNRDDVIRVLGEKFGLKTDFTEAEKEKIQDLAEKLQNENLNPAKRNKLAMEFLIVIAGASDIPVTQILANFWTSNILFGPQTIFSIASAFLNGAYGITTIGLARGFRSLTKGDIKGAIEESLATLDGIGRYLSAFPSSFNRAWQYLWSGDIAFLSSGANDVLSQVKTLEDLRNFKNYKMLAENLAKDPSTIRRYVGLYLRFVSRLLTALDAFNIMVTQAGHTSIALRQAGLTTEKIKEAEMALDLEPYKKKIIEEEFEGKKPTTLEGKALLRSLAEAEMVRALNELGAKMENADWAASESAMTMNPTGFGGGIYKAFTGTDKKLRNVADDFLNKTKKKWVSEKDLFNGLELALAYFVHFAAYQAANVAGYKFIRYASNKFNQGISYLPVIGLLRNYEKGNQNIKGKEAFMDSLYRNQMVSFALGVVGYFVLKAITDEPDDEKRNFIWNGGWDNLTPDQIKQKLSSGEKPYTIVIKYNGKGYVFNYQNWPWNQIGAAIGAMSDQIRFSPNQWNEKGIVNKMLSAVVSGTSAALEMPAVSQLAEVFGTKSIASKDPTEQALNKFNRIVSGWTGGFTPRMLKDFDFFTEPSLRKYEGLWEKTASQIPIYRRYVGEEYYDILGKQIEKNVIPGSREFMMKRTDPEYKILGALNARNIWLTPANAEYRMVGKGRNRRRLTQEEADAYSLETGRGYRDMLLRYGQRALQMPTERARAFLQDKAEEVRDRALKRAYRR